VFGGLGGRAGDEERERDKRPVVNMDFARSKAPWGRETSRGESEARLLDGETGEVGPTGGEPRRLRLFGGSHVVCRFLVKGTASSEWMIWLRGGARGDGELGWSELKARRSGGRRLRRKLTK
jgi:hypothetical protein